MYLYSLRSMFGTRVWSPCFISVVPVVYLCIRMRPFE
uniref:Uncharacterized protein n=1 Tax=Rhizophora mucronata TaxID=61149 RepID=A0A2P2JIJ1_RHIMU